MASRKKRRGDWFKVHRRILKSAIFTDPELLKVAIWAMAKARFSPGTVTIRSGNGFTQIDLEVGQFVTGRLAAALELDMPASSVRNRLARLAKLDFLDIKVDRGWSVVTLCNWRRYQDKPKGSGQQAGHGEDTARTQKKNVPKNGKNELKETGAAESGSFQEVSEQMLRSSTATEAWRVASNIRFENLGSTAARLLVQSAAAHALRIGSNPAALFVSNLAAGRDFITNEDEAEGLKRVRELDGYRPSPALAEAGIDIATILRSTEVA